MTRLLLEAWALAASLQLALWLVQHGTKNAGIVDVGWAYSFALICGLFALRTSAPLWNWLPLALVVSLWSLRLGTYLVVRGAASPPEEGRYKHLRAKWGARANASFFVFFQAQALLAAVLSTALVVPFSGASPRDAGWLRALGASVTSVALVGEALSDWQLARFKRSHKGAVCDVGLWSWSRHPNYFFEWCVWLGLALYGLAFAPLGLLAIGGQALIFCSIFFVTGIPPTEAQSLRSRGDAYRAYQRRVSRFVPLPPKRA